MKIRDFKLAVASPALFSDEAVEQLFLSLTIANESDITEAYNSLRFHRPQLLERLEREHAGRRRS